MIRYTIPYLLSVVSLFIFLTACDNEEKYDGPSPSQIDAIYSNKLSAADGGNLTLTYSGQPFIGKDVYFKMKNARTADMTLFGILPGEPKTEIPDIALTPGTDKYAFTGKATATNGTAFHYEGTVEAGRLNLALADVQLPPSALTDQGNWYIIHSGKNRNTVYNGVGGNSTTLIGTLYSLILNRLVGNAISSVLDRVTFLADGTVTATYAPLPDSVKIGNLISGYGVTGRPASDWESSPANLASYYVGNGTDLYIIPNIDMIIRQVQLNKSTKTGENDLATNISKLYKRLNAWSTTGIRLSIRTDNPAGLLLVLEKEEIEDLFLLIDIAKAILPAETLDLPLTEALSGIIPSEYAPIIDLFLKGATLGSTLDLLRQELNTIPLEIGLYLSKEQTFN